MRIVVVGLILLSLTAAGGTVLLVKQFLEAESQNQTATAPVEQAQVPEPTISVFVLTADTDMPAGTTVKKRHLKWHNWPEDMVTDAFVISPNEDAAILEEYVGAVVRREVLAGTPMTPNMIFHRSNAGFMAGLLTPGMRAVSIDIKPERGAAGFILPGDHVDVILTQDIRGSTARDSSTTNGNIKRYAAETILSDIRVVAIDQEFDDTGEEALVAKTVTLELTPKGVEIISLAREMGEIYLSLRSLAVEPPFDERGFTTDYEISRSLSASLIEGNRQASPTGSAIEVYPEIAQPTTNGIKVYRGVKESIRELPN